MGLGSGKDWERKTLGIGHEHKEWITQRVKYRFGYTHGVEYKVGYINKVGDKVMGDS